MIFDYQLVCVKWLWRPTELLARMTRIFRCSSQRLDRHPQRSFSLPNQRVQVFERSFLFLFSQSVCKSTWKQQQNWVSPPSLVHKRCWVVGFFYFILFFPGTESKKELRGGRMTRWLHVSDGCWIRSSGQSVRISSASFFICQVAEN